MKDRSRMRIRVTGDPDDAGESLRYWLSRPAGERIEAVEILREQLYTIKHSEALPHIRRVITIRDAQ